MKPKIRKIAVTGVSGMVGGHIVQYAASQGISCVVTSRHRPRSLPSLAEWRSWDLCRWLEVDALDALFGNVEALLHVGAMTPRKNITIAQRDMFDANVRSCLCLGLWALQKNIPVIYLSGAVVYADPEAHQIKENALLGYQRGKLGGFYGVTKSLGEEVFTTLAAEGLHLCVLRPSSIYGTGLSDDQMISIFFSRGLKGEDIVINAPPGSRVNLIHAADVATAMLTVLQRGVAGTFNIAAPKTFTIVEIAQKVLHVCGKRGIVVQQKESLKSPFLRFDLNCSAAEDAFGFASRIGFEEGLRYMKDGAFGI
ncbi:MAG: NAD(P)-dependent oxidoreductase [Deltaproteobacteria bacterium]|nr:NAD(P)-dependent oxidoreductase [Deltaproteobacteria bacterium]